MLTVGELREVIKDLPDDMFVGKSGHFGVFLEAYSAYPRSGLLVNGKPGITGFDRSFSMKDKITAIEYLHIDMPEIEPLED